MSELQGFFNTQTKNAAKKKKKRAAAGTDTAQQKKAEVEVKNEIENSLHEANVDDFEEDEEQKTEDLMSTNTHIKDMTEVQQAKKREQEKNKAKDWSANLQSQPEAVASKDTAPKQKKTFDASSAFGGGGRPTFSKKSGAGLNKGGDFPAMGDFPTLGADGKSESKKDNFKPMAFSKSDNAEIGSFGAGAAQPRSEAPAGGISFGKAPPKFSRKTDKKTQESSEIDLGKQNYDFSKMQVASATVRKVEGEDEEQKEGQTSVQGTRKVRDKGQDFDPNAPQKFSNKQAAEDDDDFTVVTNVKAAPSQFTKGSTGTKPIDMTKPARNQNKFNEHAADWGFKKNE